MEKNSSGNPQDFQATLESNRIRHNLFKAVTSPLEELAGITLFRSPITTFDGDRVQTRNNETGTQLKVSLQESLAVSNSLVGGIDSIDLQCYDTDYSGRTGYTHQLTVLGTDPETQEWKYLSLVFSGYNGNVYHDPLFDTDNMTDEEQDEALRKYATESLETLSPDESETLANMVTAVINRLKESSVLIYEV